MNKKSYFIIGLFVVIFIAFVILQIRGEEDIWLCQNGQWVKHGNPQAPMPTTPCLAEQIINDQPTSANITIDQPTINQSVSSPVTIEGLARVFENVLQVRLKDNNGKILVEQNTMANSLDMGLFGPYQVSLVYSNPETKTGQIEAFQYSARDGSEIDKVTIPVSFADYQSLIVKVFFGNQQLDPAALDCAKVFPVDREIAKTTAVGWAALEELLKGPDFLNQQNGYFSSINQGVKINSLEIKDGLAKVDFDEQLENQLAGSCRVTAIRAQITETLKQFASVETVEISINGRTEDILQP